MGQYGSGLPPAPLGSTPRRAGKSQQGGTQPEWSANALPPTSTPLEIFICS